MFTIADICNIAVQIERNGEQTYRNAGFACKNPEVSELLFSMAEDEKRHGKWLATIASQQPLNEEHREMEAAGRILLQDMVEGNPFLLSEGELESADNVAEVLRRSKTFEADTILFYQFIENFLDDREAVRQMQTIIAEEGNHINLLEQLENDQLSHKPVAANNS